MNIPTIIILAIVVVVFLAIIIREIRNKKNGKGSCSCGGNCGACGMNCSCHSEDTNNQNQQA